MTEHEAESSNRLREGRARGEAAYQGLRLEKSRSSRPQAPEYGTYTLTDIATNTIVALGLGSSSESFLSGAVGWSNALRCASCFQR